MPQIAPLVAGDPSQLGSFTLSGRIGEGGQGIVYLGSNEAGELAAIKLLHIKFSGDTSARSRFARELRAAQRVASFCTASVVEADLEGNTPYIASEYIDGRSLREIVDTDGPLVGAALDRLAIGTATALTTIHNASIIHRDFKPDNVLIAADGPRVVDFGIARIVDSTGTITSRAIGTPAYMAPEQIAGEDIGSYTDVFAWGATIAFAATGETVFEGNSIAVVLNRILNHEVDVSALPEPLRGVVRSALSKSPADRPSADQILLRLLGHPDRGGASADVLSQGAQVASIDTTPFARVSTAVATPLPTVSQPLPLGKPLPSGKPGRSGRSELAGLVSLSGPFGPPPPPAHQPARRAPKTPLIVLVVALLLVAVVVGGMALGGWPIGFGSTPDPEKSNQPTFTAIADKVATTGKITIGVKNDLPGVSKRNGDGTYEGFDIDLARRIATALGAEPDGITFVPVSKFTRAEALRSGKVDLVVATYSIDKEKIAFAGPYYVGHQDVLVRDGSPFTKLSHLQGQKLCAPDRSASVGKVQQQVDMEAVYAKDYAECVNLLATGKVDAIPGDDLILAGFANREPARYKILGAKLSDERYAVGIGQGDARTCKAVQGIIKSLVADKTVSRLLDTHFGNVTFKHELKLPAMEPC